MAELTAEEFAQRAFELDLVNERNLQEAWAQVGTREVSGDEFRQLLIRREALTNFQAEKLLRGERSGYFYGDYKVLYIIGTGTFARVYRAVHRTSGDLAAVKVLRSRFADDKEQAERFFREGNMGAQLRHPNIVPIYEVASQGRSHYMVMAFIEGRNLREFIKIRKKFVPAEATRLAIDIASGLQYAFAKGICHRDLKMSNVLVSSRGQAKLVDFGLAGGDLSDDAIASTPNPRTIDYAGLERATGVRKDDPRSDIYFLGCILYHLLSGVAPLYETKDRIQRLSKTRFETVAPLLTLDPQLPRSLVLVVNKAMELNPDNRYQSPGEMLADLKMASDRIGEPDLAGDDDEAALSRLRSSATANLPQRTLMVVESNEELQNIFRERLKSSGYRVLVTRDPMRALERFAEDGPKTADCVVFSTGELKEPALEAFNRFAENKSTCDIPAILLLGEKQKSWTAKAKLAEHRVAVSLPLKLKQLREVLAQLVPVGVK